MRAKIWISFVLIFFAGIALGLIGGGSLVRYYFRKCVTEPTAMKSVLMKKLAFEVRLSSEQAARADVILNKAILQANDVINYRRPELERIFTTAFDEIGASMDEKQKSRLKKSVEEVMPLLIGPPPQSVPTF